MHKAKDTYSLTDFKQNTTEHLERLKKTGRPEVLTVNGKAEAVVMSAEAFDQIMGDAIAELRAKIAVGVAQAEAGMLIDGEEAFRQRRAMRANVKRRAG